MCTVTPGAPEFLEQCCILAQHSSISIQPLPLAQPPILCTSPNATKRLTCKCKWQHSAARAVARRIVGSYNAGCFSLRLWWTVLYGTASRGLASLLWTLKKFHLAMNAESSRSCPASSRSKDCCVNFRRSSIVERSKHRCVNVFDSA